MNKCCKLNQWNKVTTSWNNKNRNFHNNSKLQLNYFQFTYNLLSPVDLNGLWEIVLVSFFITTSDALSNDSLIILHSLNFISTIVPKSQESKFPPINSWCTLLYAQTLSSMPQLTCYLSNVINYWKKGFLGSTNGKPLKVLLLEGIGFVPLTRGTLKYGIGLVISCILFHLIAPLLQWLHMKIFWQSCITQVCQCGECNLIKWLFSKCRQNIWSL